MGNLVDYLAEITAGFGEKPFGDVDSLVLSQLSYLDFNGLVPGPGQGFVPFEALASDEAVASLVKNDRVPELDAQLVHRTAENPRFCGMQIGGYVNIIDREAQEQFSAVTFRLEDFTYVAYRGTDSTYVGWKEDFNLAFVSPVPSQAAGAAYLDWVSSLVPGPLRVGGHSKGGNIAVYSSLFCGSETRKRVATVYSHDGPGFSEGVLQSPEFAEMRDRLHKTMPQSSLVGVLLQHQENYRVIRSGQFWIMQHDPFSWLVENGDFQYLEELSSGARFLDKNLNAWISSLSAQELSNFADALYKVLCALPGESFTDTPDKWWEAARETLSGLKGLDSDTYTCILRVTGSLFSMTLKNMPRPKPPFSLPEIPAPKVKNFSPPPLAEALLRQLPFYKKESASDQPDNMRDQGDIRT